MGTEKETWGLNTLDCKDQIQMYIAFLLLTPILNKMLYKITRLETDQSRASYSRAIFLLDIPPDPDSFTRKFQKTLRFPRKSRGNKLSLTNIF